MHTGYNRAFATIVDANVTTLIVAMVLFALGSGVVKSFAITLTIGILTSMVTAIFFTRGMVNLIYGRRSVKTLSIGIKKTWNFLKPNTNIDFMGQRKWAALFSIVLFIASIVSFLVYGLNLGLDFTGGTQIEVTYPQPPNIQQIRQELASISFKDAVVQTYGTSRDILIRIAPHQHISTQDQLQESDFKCVAWR